MTIPPSKLAAARIAAAEVLTAEGLQGTNWAFADGTDRLRGVAELTTFDVRWRVGKRGEIVVSLGRRGGRIRALVAPKDFGELSPDEAERAARKLAKVTAIARKVEAAIAKVAGEEER
jgi:hypothetical protein